MKFFACALSALVVLSIELTSENWDEETAKKTVFVNFFDPTHEDCKEPFCKELMTKFRGKTTLIADVDCTAAGTHLLRTLFVKYLCVAIDFIWD